MKYLGDVTTEELEIELERRRQAKEIKKPVALESPNFSFLVETCQNIIDRYEEMRYSDEDDTRYVYEVAMVAIFGPTVFEWINNVVD